MLSKTKRSGRESRAPFCNAQFNGPEQLEPCVKMDAFITTAPHPRIHHHRAPRSEPAADGTRIKGNPGSYCRRLRLIQDAPSEKTRARTRKRRRRHVSADDSSKSVKNTKDFNAPGIRKPEPSILAIECRPPA